MRDYSFLRRRQPGIIGEAAMHRAAVAVTLLDASAGEEVLFEVRSEKIGHQPGDVCCPGGMVEKGETAEQAAVREMTEELLVTPEQIRVLGPLDFFCGGNMLVQPFVCLLKDYRGGFCTGEVSEVFRVPLSFFLENMPEVHEVVWKVEMGEDFPFEKIHGGKNYPWRQRRDRILFYEYGGHVIWGMTAKLMESLAELLRREG